MNSTVTIRMYRQGLGDCFLLTFDREDQPPFHILIDCGALNSKHYDVNLMIRVVEHIRHVTGGTLHVIVLTHEHWDHISGFNQAEELFRQFEVRNVWTAWTEDPGRSDVANLKERFKKKKAAVRAALAQMPDGNQDHRLGLYKDVIGELFGFFGGIKAAEGFTERAWKNAMALGKNHYLDPKKAPVEIPELPGVRFYCLGPPDDPELIKKTLSSKETYEKDRRGMTLADAFYAALHASEDPARAAQAQPFDARYQVSITKARVHPWFSKRYAFETTDDDYWRSIDHDWLASAGELALHLDSFTNNTCLAFAIELREGGDVLLFPGDAQVGNWQSWETLSWSLPSKSSLDHRRTVTADDLLARTVLYKVGHHGSHNATMKAKGLEKMESRDLVAMIPVHRATAQDQKWQFPFKPLWDRLKEKTRGRVLLADSMSIADIEPDLGELTPDEKTRFQKAVSHEELCVRYVIAL